MDFTDTYMLLYVIYINTCNMYVVQHIYPNILSVFVPRRVQDIPSTLRCVRGPGHLHVRLGVLEGKMHNFKGTVGQDLISRAHFNLRKVITFRI